MFYDYGAFSLTVYVYTLPFDRRAIITRIGA